MRLPRLRFTVRRLMAVVAVLALVLGVSVEAVRLARLRDRFLKLAAEHRNNELAFRQMEQTELELAQIHESFLEQSEAFDQRTARLRSRAFLGRKGQEIARGMAEITQRQKDDAARTRAQAAIYHKAVVYYAALEQKYRAAAARPWRSIEPDPPPPDPPSRALYWSERGDYGLTVAAYQEVLKHDPDDPTAQNGLAWVLATCPDARYRDGKRAIELATQACQVSDWNEPAYLDTLAAAYAEAGDFPNAVRFQREAIAKLPAGDPTRAGFLDRVLLYQSNKPYRMNAQTRM